MPTPPTYTNAFRVVGSLVNSGTGQPSWGYFRSAVVASAVDYAAGTSSYDYTATAYPSITASTDNLLRTWFPFQLGLVFNQSFSGNPTHFVVRGYQPGDPDDYDYPYVAEEDFSLGVVGATVTAYNPAVPGYATFTIIDEAGNHNGVAQDTISFQGPITAIVLP
jgi:hypothetical protein